MQRSEIQVGQKVIYRKQLCTVSRLLGYKVFVVDPSGYEDLVSPRSLHSVVELTVEHVDSEPAIVLAGEATKPPVVQGLTVPQWAWVTACDAVNGRHDIERSKWQPLDYVAAAAGIVGFVGLNWIISMLG